jgi:small subunit ribosomal protein S6
MAVQLYETMFLLDSGKLAGDPDGIRAQLGHGLEKHGAEIIVTRPWDDRKLSYPIQKQKKGSYHIVYYRIESTKQAEIEQDLRLNENLLRHLTLLIDPKWSEVALDVARNDTAAAFAIRGMQDEVNPSDVSPNMPEGMPEGEAVAAATAARRPRREGPEKPE